jgi:valyl-tRNA synthetase
MINKTFTPAEIESKWYDYWLEHKMFKSVPNEKEAYTIVIPPPNVTGVLHLGHTLNNTIQDILIRRARMLGYNACWVPGTDHASIATENKVIELLAEQGIEKKDLTREDFLKHAFDWKEKYGGIILKQLRHLGASCDWDRAAFTMDDERYKSVIKVFVDLYNKGLIYRGARMVNWDPKRQTALSDEEVYHKDVTSKFYTVQYQIEGSDEHITIATTRPETIMADAAICVHPEDERYAHLKGKKAIVPIVNRAIPIIFDEYVDIEFGTGALKVTPAHDINDHKLGMKYDLPVIDIINDNGTINEKAEVAELIGLDRFKARREIAILLEDSGNLLKVEEIQNKVGCSERSGEVIEPKISTQWFCSVTDMAKTALDKVEDNTVNLVPPKFKNTYRHWMENIKDWCISRQLWWGHQIPAYYLPNGEVVVAETSEQALSLAQAKDASITSLDQLKQDDDVMDTWFSSWLWPLSVFGGIMEPENEEVKYYYPTNVLVTGHDIIFFWVARMVMAGYQFSTESMENRHPFKDVYMTGMVRDKQGRKMSKSLGNSPDLFKLLEKYGADGVRTGVLFSSAAGNDLLFDEKQCEQGRNFANKIWNASNLVEMFKENVEEKDCPNEPVFNWFEGKLSEAITAINKSYDDYRISEALMSSYRLVWDDFCSWYLEMVKPNYGETLDQKTLDKTISYFETLMKILHPMMPFLTEELWQNVVERKEGESIMYAAWPNYDGNAAYLKKGDLVKELISGIRNVRNENEIKPKETVDLFVTGNIDNYKEFESIFRKLGNIEVVSYSNDQPEQAKSFMVGTDEFFIPVEIDVEAEIEVLKKDLEYNKGFLIAVDKKLSNDRFVSGAPEAVVAKEQQKKADVEEKIRLIEDQLSKLA